MAHIALDADGFVVATHKGFSAHNPLEMPESGSLGTCSEEVVEKIVKAFNAGKRARLDADQVIEEDHPIPAAPPATPESVKEIRRRHVGKFTR